jgi:hypothetical protein
MIHDLDVDMVRRQIRIKESVTVDNNTVRNHTRGAGNATRINVNQTKRNPRLVQSLMGPDRQN